MRSTIYERVACVAVLWQRKKLPPRELSNLKWMFNDTSFIRIPECASQLEECNARRLMALAEHYLIVIKGTPTKSELQEMILEEERRREVKGRRGHFR